MPFKKLSLIFIAPAILVLAVYGGLAFQKTTQRASAAPQNYGKRAKLEVAPLAKTGSLGNFKTLEMGIPEPKMPESIKVYSVVNTPVDRTSVEERARRFGVSGKYIDGDELITVRGEDADFTVDRATGSENWLTPAFEETVDPMTHKLSDEEYIELAKKFLRERQAYKDSYVFKGFNYFKSDEQIMMVEVLFGQQLNGRAWEGVGPKKSVVFGDNGKVLAMFSVWRDAEEYEPFPIIRPADAKANILAGKSTTYLEEYDADGTVEQIELVYHNEPAGYAQKFVIPHYVFKGTTSKGKKFTAVTRAVPEELIKETAQYRQTPVPEDVQKRGRKKPVPDLK